MALAEYGNLLSAVRTFEVAHILNKTEDRNIHFLRHVDRLLNDHGDKLLRGGNDDDSIDRKRLKYSKRHIAGSRRHIYEHIVDILPECLTPELFHCTCDHRTTPDHRICLILQKHIGGDHLNTSGGSRRDKELSIRSHCHAIMNPKGSRDRRTCDIRIKDSYSRTRRAHAAGHQGCH